MRTAWSVHICIVYISALCVCFVCLCECVLGTLPALTRLWVCACLCDSARVLRAAACLLAFQLHLCPQSGSAREPASLRTFPSDPSAVCKDLRVVCTWFPRACLSARTNAPPHIWVHVPLCVCTLRVHAAHVCVQGTARARALACGRPRIHAGLHASPGADPRPPSAPGRGPLRLAIGSLSAVTPPSPATRAPAVPAVPRGSGEAAPRCALLPLAARAFVWRQLRPQRL